MPEARISWPLRRIGGAGRRRLGRTSEPGVATPTPEPGPFDSWLSHFHGERLERIDAACAGAGPEAFALFSGLDDDLWAVLLAREYELYPNIRALLPEMPEVSLQALWNGWTGMRLLNESKAFYALVKALGERHGRAGPPGPKVLDYGCGWGRLTRFFARDVAPGALFGCDPVAEILEVCERTRVPALLARSDFVPERLPFEERFDLVFAFSVFTHLSESAHQSCLRAIHRSLSPGGLLVATIRPPAYLDHCERLRPLRDSLGPDPLGALGEPRYLFAPHEAEPDHPQFQGREMTYGETVISLPYVRSRWAPLFELLEVRLLTEDLHQVVLTLRAR